VNYFITHGLAMALFLKTLVTCKVRYDLCGGVYHTPPTGQAAARPQDESEEPKILHAPYYKEYRIHPARRRTGADVYSGFYGMGQRHVCWENARGLFR